MSELKPCPFCGAKETDGEDGPEILLNDDYEQNFIACGCGIKTRMCKPRNISRLIKEWNTRPELQEAKELLKSWSDCTGSRSLLEKETDKFLERG